MIDELTDDLTDDQAAETPNVPTDETPNETTEPADPKQRKRRAEHHAELLLGLANQSKQSSGDVDAADPTELELWDRATVLKFFGGSKPIHPATLYRNMASGIYPRPIHVSANVVRWVADECRAATQRMLAARDDPKPPSPRRGRKRRQIDPSPTPTR
jgi:predicted DNA-binding transcriptional regulator AlpA